MKYFYLFKLLNPFVLIKIFKLLISKLIRHLEPQHYGRTLILDKLIKENGFKSVVELGVYDGKNLIYLAKNNPQTNFVGIDLWKHFDSDRINTLKPKNQSDWDDLYNLLILETKSIQNLRLIRSDTIEAADTFENLSIDLIFVDASHDYRDVKNDILTWLPKISTTGIISGHDYGLQYIGVIKAVTEVFGTDNLDVLYDAVWVTKPKYKI